MGKIIFCGKFRENQVFFEACSAEAMTHSCRIWCCVWKIPEVADVVFDIKKVIIITFNVFGCQKSNQFLHMITKLDGAESCFQSMFRLEFLAISNNLPNFLVFFRKLVYGMHLWWTKKRKVGFQFQWFTALAFARHSLQQHFFEAPKLSWWGVNVFFQTIPSISNWSKNPLEELICFWRLKNRWARLSHHKSRSSQILLIHSRKETSLQKSAKE